MPKLTKKVVERLRPRADADYVVWDDVLPGFGVRVWPSGKLTYIAKYRTEEGRQRKWTIGQHGPLTAEQAREAAHRVLGAARLGDDPAKSRREARKAARVVDLADRYMREHAHPKKRPGSALGDEILLRLHILPRLGSLKVRAVTREDVTRLHKDMEDTSGAANRTLALLSKMFNLAEKWEIRQDGSNPCRHVEKYRERKLERFLSPAELKNLGRVLVEAEHAGNERPSVIAAIRLLLLTGCRLSEILTLKWADIDIPKRLLRIRESKTGAKTVHLSQPAVEILQAVERQSNNLYVIAGEKPGTHLVNLRKAWYRIRAKADLQDVRIHDLRHTFASVAASSGLSLPIIGGLLGHSQAQTTTRYAHLAASPLQHAADLTGATIASSLTGETK